jgi:hypothetical protein
VHASGKDQEDPKKSDQESAKHQNFAKIGHCSEFTAVILWTRRPGVRGGCPHVGIEGQAVLLTTTPDS